MFEPENQVERDLVSASAEPSARPGFMRSLLESEIFVVLVPESGTVVPGPDGAMPAGAKLNFRAARRGDEDIVPFFSAPSRARAWYKGDHVIAARKARDLFGRFPGMPFVLNPGSDYGKEFTPGEIKEMLAGRFGGTSETETIQQPEPVLLAHPKDPPGVLIAALAKELRALKSVRGAWLMLATRAGKIDQSWMLGVDQTGDWNEVRAAIGRAVMGNVLQGRMLDAMPLDDSELASTLRTGIPILARKRGLLGWFR